MHRGLPCIPVNLKPLTSAQEAPGLPRLQLHLLLLHPDQFKPVLTPGPLPECPHLPSLYSHSSSFELQLKFISSKKPS